MSRLPVFYSFRRCPYAIRARMAIASSGLSVDLREVVLKHKPPCLLSISPKGTVPVLQLLNGHVIDESIDIMFWALQQNDPDFWLGEKAITPEYLPSLIIENDTIFKKNLDRYKYFERFPEKPQLFYRSQCEVFLEKLENRLGQHAFLLSEKLTLVDIAIFPFIRQFIFVDKAWFDRSSFKQVGRWANLLIASQPFQQVMLKYPAFLESGESFRFP